MYLWKDSYGRRDSCKEFICIYGGFHIQEGIHIRSPNVSMEGFIYREGFI